MKKYYDQVASVGCILCNALGYGATPSEIHHIRRFGQKRDGAEVIPLCLEHHRGKTGVHGLGRKAFERKYGLTEQDLHDNLVKILNNVR